MEKRIYVVKKGDVEYLVRAGNKVQAINYIARKDVTAEVASQDDIIRLIAEGVEEA